MRIPELGRVVPIGGLACSLKSLPQSTWLGKVAFHFNCWGIGTVQSDLQKKKNNAPQHLTEEGPTSLWTAGLLDGIKLVEPKPRHTMFKTNFNEVRIYQLNRRRALNRSYICPTFTRRHVRQCMALLHLTRHFSRSQKLEVW